MHPNRAFAADQETALRLVQARPFAAVTAWTGEGLVTVQTPLIPVFGQGGALSGFEGHLARANRFYAALQDRGSVHATAVFFGPDAYVSPSYYPSKALTGRVVPTWNYLTAEAEGELQIHDDPGIVRAILDRQAAAFEAGLASVNEAWRVADAPQDYITPMMRAIAGVSLRVTRFEATKKLGQNKTGADFKGVLEALAAREDPGARGVAALMTELERG
ncbi:MAG: FMN-binding negative transcriptional regulator [Oceanicaulis sp.]